MLLKPTYSKKTKHKNILAQKSSDLTKKRRRWLVTLASLPLFGMVTAFGFAPNTAIDDVAVEWVEQDLLLPKVVPETLSSNRFWQHETIRRGDTISAILDRLGARQQDTAAFLSVVRANKAIRKLTPGKTVYAYIATDGELLTFRYFFGKGKILLIEKIDDTFRLTEEDIQLDVHTAMKSGVIKSSLFAATDQAGIPSNIATQLAEIFASDIDFHQDLRQGDQFKVIYETLLEKGEQTKTGRILAAEFVNKNSRHQAIYFESAYGDSGYYAPSGKSLKKEFLRAPVAFSRISSGFSNRRFHPVLKKWRSHRGVDYAAPRGAPVYATADGTVTVAESQRGYGNLIVLKHRGKYDTAYGHLQGFAKGLRKGKRVQQGDIIGYVGSTGMATGPHLHYELRVNGVQVDPQSVISTGVTRLALQELNTFYKQSISMVSRLHLMRGEEIVIF